MRTDRIDARRMVRALRAWDGGDRETMSRARIPTVGQEDGRRLQPWRERLVKERRRPANAVGGLKGLHGVSLGDPARQELRARPGGRETGAEHGSLQDAASSIQMGTAPGTWRRPEPGIVVTGSADADQPNRTGGRTRRRARNGTATFRLEDPRWHSNRPRRRYG